MQPQLQPQRKIRIAIGTDREKTWRAIRIKQKFTLDELARAVFDSGDRAADPVDNIRRFVVALEKAGYLISMKKRVPGTALTSNGFKRWMLVRDTGPKNPIPRKSGVWDQNDGVEYPFTEAK